MLRLMAENQEAHLRMNGAWKELILVEVKAFFIIHTRFQGKGKELSNRLLTKSL